MSRTPAALMLALATLTLAACTSQIPDPSTTTASPSASLVAEPAPSASPTPPPPVPSPSATTEVQDVTVPPERPAALSGPATEESAKAVGRYVLSLVPYAFATGDLTEWNALSGEPCNYCKSVRETVTDIFDAGGHGTGGALELGFTSAFDLGHGEFVVGLEYYEAPAQTVARDGTVTDETTETASYKANLSLVWSGSSWKVKGVQVDPWGASK
ncbi:DUF6318 family protein [Cellulomonas palmilytica]|uniref:DUF6318 family protein n=1 Tax=Cellulomonas palmilytica TaxID=2608402 RepID=UPI001F2B2E9B|nr:DUF6318 family protein [Cellulomonas palmilytica]UJP40135.1 hypothetical protein F1D97_00825 [Cellulomonas palmilytica]